MEIGAASHRFAMQYQRLDIQRVSERLSLGARSAEPSDPPPGRAGALDGESQSWDEMRKELREQLNVQILKAFIQRFLGIDFQASIQLNPDDWQADPLQLDPALAGLEIEFERIEERFEAESLRLDMQASLQLADGRRLDASLSLAMDRQFYSRNAIHLQSGQRQDPLILDFTGQGVALSDRRVDFDLRADGSLLRMPVPEAGNALLVKDRNGNGVIDDGSEVPGALSGDVWADLRRLDADNNGFIDRADPAFQRLGLLMFDPNGGQRLYSLQQLGVKAIALDAIESPFSLTDANNNRLGEIRSTGYFLTDSLAMRPAQQVDFFV